MELVLCRGFQTLDEVRREDERASVRQFDNDPVQAIAVTANRARGSRR